MATARNIMTLALEGMNRLSPGETIDADLAAACLRRLNSIADDWSAGRDMMPQDQTTSGSVTGTSLTLAAGSFAAITPGDEILSMTADNLPMEPITIQQYNAIYTKTTQGRPQYWVSDGLVTVYLYPAASANTIAIVSRKPFSSFADLDTVYTLPSGYEGAFAATLAVAMAPALLGKVTPDLVAAERRALANIANSIVRPAMLSSDPLSRRGRVFGNILQGWH
jgi:hypothetical protein